ncbi:hypothetical protein ACFV1L_12195 [Kitasatospora sp. NPDC059646]|uniref:hypothetical protein n=1 Tax=Kitasatospora sp. NPDC059646 TaxID=3346893 RepID=UPI0036D166EF
MCAELIADGPLDDPRTGLWWRLVGACTGEVMVRCCGGEWADAGDDSDGPAVRAPGLTAFPFNTAHRVLLGEEGKSLPSSASLVAAIARHRGLAG